MVAILAPKDSEVSAKFEAIEALDLGMVKMKLCLPAEKEGKAWSQEEADLCEEQYKRFLKLCVLYPNTDIVPSRQIDEMWHQHILDTRAYERDCQSIFGHMLHHFPYFGLRDEQDAQDLADSFSITCALFIKHFGQSPPVNASGCNGQGGSGSGGGGGKCSRKVYTSRCG
jgi:hypothetical protein